MTLAFSDNKTYLEEMTLQIIRCSCHEKVNFLARFRSIRELNLWYILLLQNDIGVFWQKETYLEDMNLQIMWYRIDMSTAYSTHGVKLPCV